MRGVRTILLAASLVLPASATVAQSCSGNACDVITLQRLNNGCIGFVNSGNRPVKISHNVAGVSVGVAYANSTYQLMAIEGYCMTGFGADYTANYT